METVEELKEYVKNQALLYENEYGNSITKFPTSIVDFVIETVPLRCHFPDSYTEGQTLSLLVKGKNTLAVMCTDVYAKAGGEGETSHTENSVSRSYEAAWITPSLFSAFPNFATVF